MTTTDNRDEWPITAILRGHTTPETAHVSHDYPDGFKVKCKRRVWLHTADKGTAKGETRFMYQTSDERHGRPDFWRTAKAGTYTTHMWLVERSGVDKDGNAVTHADHVSIHMGYYSFQSFVDFYNKGIWPLLTDDERAYFIKLQTFDAARRPDEFERFNRIAWAMGHPAASGVLPEGAEVTDLSFLNERQQDAARRYVEAEGPLFGLPKEDAA